MRPVTDRFLAALRNPHVVVSTVDLLFPGETETVAVPITAGAVTLDRTAVVRRSGALTIPWALEAGADLGVDLRDLPFGGYARVHRGVRFPDGTTELVSLGVFRVESVAWNTAEASAGLELADRMAQVRDEPFVVPYAPAAITTPIEATGNLTDGSPIVTGMSSTAAVLVGQDVSGYGVQAGTTVVSIDGPTQITMSRPASLYARKTVAGLPNSALLDQIDGTENLSSGMLVTLPPNRDGDAMIPAGTYLDYVRDASSVYMTKAANNVTFWGSGSPPGFAEATFTVNGTGVLLTFGGGKRIADAAVDLVFAVFGDAIEYRKVWDPAVILSDVYFSQNRADGLMELAKAAAGETYFDAEGAFVFGPPSGGGASVWDVDAGEAGVLVAADEALDRTGVYNGVLVTGQGTADTAPVSALVVDDDPDSPTRWGGPLGKVARTEQSSAVQTASQAEAAAAALLERRIGLQRSLVLRAAPNPALEPGDVIDVAFPDGRTERHVVDVIRLTLGPTESQELGTRTTFTLGRRPPLPRGPRRVHPFTLPTRRRVYVGADAFRELAR